MGKTIVISPAFAHLRPFLEEIASNGVPAENELVYQARNRVYRVVAPDGTALSIKAFRCPSFPNNYIYGNLRQGKAMRSFDNALRLLDLGFDTPEPVAFMEVSQGGAMKESYYISRHVDVDGDMRWWRDNPQARKALPQLAKLMVRMHRCGVYHRDFSPGNIMFRRKPGGEYIFYLIDLNRMRFNVHRRRTLYRNFRAIYIESEDETARLARMYATETGASPEKYDAMARRQLQKYLRGKKRKHALKHLFSKRQKND